MPHIRRPRAAADALDRAPAANAAADAAHERSEQIRLHRELARDERAPVSVSADTDAVLRRRLCDDVAVTDPHARGGRALARRLADTSDDVARTLDEIAATREQMAATCRTVEPDDKRQDAQRARDLAEAERNESRRLRARWGLPPRP